MQRKETPSESPEATTPLDEIYAADRGPYDFMSEKEEQRLTKNYQKAAKEQVKLGKKKKAMANESANMNLLSFITAPPKVFIRRRDFDSGL